MSTFEQMYYEHAGFWNDSFFNDRNAERIRRTSAHIPANITSLLDAGCGNGIFCNYYATHNPTVRVIAIDRSRSALQHVRVPNFESSIDQLPFGNCEFDCVCAFEVLEHLPIPIYDLTRQELARVATRYIAVSVPRDQVLEEDMTQCPACRTIFNPDLHMRTFSQSTMPQLFSHLGFRCKDITELGEFKIRAGLERLRRYSVRKRRLAWRSPICPVCGYTAVTESFGESPVSTLATANALKAVVKNLWPLSTRAHWLLAVYERESG